MNKEKEDLELCNEHRLSSYSHLNPVIPCSDPSKISLKIIVLPLKTNT